MRKRFGNIFEIRKKRIDAKRLSIFRLLFRAENQNTSFTGGIVFNIFFIASQSIEKSFVHTFKAFC